MSRSRNDDYGQNDLIEAAATLKTILLKLTQQLNNHVDQGIEVHALLSSKLTDLVDRLKVAKNMIDYFKLTNELKEIRSVYADLINTLPKKIIKSLEQFEHDEIAEHQPTPPLSHHDHQLLYEVLDQPVYQNDQGEVMINQNPHQEMDVLLKKLIIPTLTDTKKRLHQFIEAEGQTPYAKIALNLYLIIRDHSHVLSSHTIKNSAKLSALQEIKETLDEATMVVTDGKFNPKHLSPSEFNFSKQNIKLFEKQFKMLSSKSDDLKNILRDFCIRNFDSRANAYIQTLRDNINHFEALQTYKLVYK